MKYDIPTLEYVSNALGEWLEEHDWEDASGQEFGYIEGVQGVFEYVGELIEEAKRGDAE